MAPEVPEGGNRPPDQLQHECLEVAHQPIYNTCMDQAHSSENLPLSQAIAGVVSQEELSRDQ